METTNDLHNSKYGFWICSGVPFTSKLEALQYASQTSNGIISYYFHDHIWDNLDRTLLGKVPLTQLYKERALQLRDKYDYLVLHYSGGSDSHNILHTFLTNNIKLDEIVVRWAKPLRDGKFYKPNNTDKSARNAVSEWDYAIKPTLDWIKSNRPEIKINVVDFTERLLDHSLSSVSFIKTRMEEMNFQRGSFGGLAMYQDPNVESKMVISGSIPKTGYIFGIEKPLLYLKDNKIYAQFQDSVYDNMFMPRARASETGEAFYWTADMPLLAMEQAYQAALYFKHTEIHRNIMSTSIPMSPVDNMKKFQEQNSLLKKILYKESWNDNTFQVDKPNVSRSDWYFWLHESPEIKLLHTNWQQAMSELLEGVDSRLLQYSEENTPFLAPNRTKPFYLLSLDNT
jgi:hypothetical protein